MMNRIPNILKVAIAAASLAAVVYGGLSTGTALTGSGGRFAVDVDAHMPYHFHAHTIRDLFPL